MLSTATFKEDAFLMFEFVYNEIENSVIIRCEERKEVGMRMREHTHLKYELLIHLESQHPP